MDEKTEDSNPYMDLFPQSRPLEMIHEQSVCLDPSSGDVWETLGLLEHEAFTNQKFCEDLLAQIEFGPHEQNRTIHQEEAFAMARAGPSQFKVPELEVTTVSACAVFSEKCLDLETIGQNCWNVMYSPTAKFNSNVIVRLRKPKATVKLYVSGKVICVGARTAEDALDAVKCVGLRVSKVVPRHRNLRLVDFRVTNCVCTGDVGFPLQLDQMKICLSPSDGAKKRQYEVAYEAELFPGLTFWPNKDENKLVFILFPSGKVLATGSTNLAGLQESYRRFYCFMNGFAEFRIRHPGSTPSLQIERKRKKIVKTDRSVL